MQHILLDLRVDHMAYPSGETIMDGFAITVSHGQIISIVGASGTGKTTLLRIIAGLEKRFVGRLLFDGVVRDKPGPDIQIVFQDHRLLPWLRVRDNVAFALNRDKSHRTEDSVQNALTEVGMVDKMARWPRKLSGGEEQRVALARVLVRPPRLLLLDEPLRNLDLISAGALLRVMERIGVNHRMSMVLVSHNIEDAVALSDIVYVVASKPMRIHETIAINLDRPRDRASREFGRSCREVIRALRGAEEAFQSGNNSGEIPPV